MRLHKEFCSIVKVSYKTVILKWGSYTILPSRIFNVLCMFCTKAYFVLDRYSINVHTGNSFKNVTDYACKFNLAIHFNLLVKNNAETEFLTI